MSEARERLIEKMSHELLGHQGRANRALHAALSHPDDLLAVLVEAGVLEQTAHRDGGYGPFLYRRIEGDTR